jgi:hypothetical protein
MKRIVFYSWQSDLPNSCNRGFIQEALENAAGAIAADETVAVEPVVDRDTQGVPGAPDISTTIFAKITAADIFVADVSIVARDTSRVTPNPNVLIELGYALKALGHERVILVFNREYGKIEELPFDLRTRRVLAYDMPATGTPKAAERKILEKQFDGAIRAALQHQLSNAVPVPIPAVAALEAQVPSRRIVLRQDLEGILQRLDNLQPKRFRDGGTVEDLIAGLQPTQEVVAEFTKIVHTIAIMADGEAASDVLRWFGSVFERYEKPQGFSGRSSRADEDYFKFLGHELFVTFVATLLREDRWTLIEAVLRRPIPIKYLPHDGGPGTVDWRYASEQLPSLGDESRRRQRLSLHADILNERHTTGGLASVMPMADFVAADYFLFLVGEMTPDSWNESIFEWRPWGALYMAHLPLFLRDAEHNQTADELLKLFKIGDAEEFKRRFGERAIHLRKMFGGGLWHEPIEAKDVEYFGTA